MLEIFLLIAFCRSMGRLLRGKGRNPLLFQILVVVSWFGGELAGVISAGVMHVIQHGDAPFEPGLSVYVLALALAMVGAGFWFLIAYVLPSASAALPPDKQLAENEFAYQVPETERNNPYSPPGR